MNCASKTRNCVSKARNFALKMLNFEDANDDPLRGSARSQGLRSVLDGRILISY